MDVSPSAILAMWTAGIAGGGAVVAWWRIVGPGFTWLTGGTVILFGLGVAVFADDAIGDLPSEAVAYTGIALALGAVIVARRRRLAAAFFAASMFALLLVAAAADPSALGIGLVVTGTLLLGAITSEMMLGHWYLVDPQLPRWALQRLALAAGAGVLLDFLLLVLNDALDWVPADAVIGWAFIALAVFTFVLVIAVWYSLQEPGYTGVMAATGLSYLAVLTAFGEVVLGRILV